ncbi:response regulator [Phycisphaeraceae bacterium D3-23]
MKSRDHEPIETLRISDRDKQKLVNSVNAGGGKSVKHERRALRVQYTEAKAILTLHMETGGSTRLAVVPRNLSRRGMAFVHGRFIYADARCEVMLKTLAGEWETLPGVIRSCRHVSGIVHEVAVVFDGAIDLSEYCHLSPEEEMIHLQELAADIPEGADDSVARNVGSVLVVDDFPTDRKLFGLWLGRAGFETHSASDAAQARKQVDSENFDLAVIDLRLSKENGLDLIKSLRAAGFSAPIVAVSADEEAKVGDAAKEAGANAFLTKPFTVDQLLEHAQSLLGIDLTSDEDQQPIFSTVKDDEEMAPLLTEFVRGLSGYITKLRDANAKDDLDAVEGMTHILKGAGSGYGFDPITEQAGEVLKVVENERRDMEKIKQQVNALIRVLHRVKL